jgi:hypothetical protein
MSEKYNPEEFARREFLRQLEEGENGGEPIQLVQEGDSETEDIVLEYLDSEEGEGEE